MYKKQAKRILDKMKADEVDNPIPMTGDLVELQWHSSTTFLPESVIRGKTVKGVVTDIRFGPLHDGSRMRYEVLVDGAVHSFSSEFWDIKIVNKTKND
jgi:hypothetical protein